jgi:hypothetical protein
LITRARADFSVMTALATLAGCATFASERPVGVERSARTCPSNRTAAVRHRSSRRRARSSRTDLVLDAVVDEHQRVPRLEAGVPIVMLGVVGDGHARWISQRRRLPRRHALSTWYRHGTSTAHWRTLTCAFVAIVLVVLCCRVTGGITQRLQFPASMRTAPSSTRSHRSTRPTMHQPSCRRTST